LLTLPDAATAALETLDYMLGVEADTIYQERSLPFPPGSRLLAYTDGFTDVTDCQGKLRGLAPLVQSWEKLTPLPLADACQELIKQALAAAAEGGLQDDIALLAIEHQAADGREGDKS
ncbi:MAG: SpoIIE family protein phosphatase, partial [bacterium]